MGAASTVPGISLAIWLLYFAGQALIARGVARNLDIRAQPA